MAVSQEQTKRVRARMLGFKHVFVGFAENPPGSKRTNKTRCPACGALAIVAEVEGPDFNTEEEFGTALEYPCDAAMVDKRLVFAPWNDEDTKARAERIAREDEQRRIEKKERRTR